MLFLPQIANSQETDTLVYCDNPSVWAEFPEENGNVATWFLKNSSVETLGDSIVGHAKFYFNVVVLNDGTVAKFNLEYEAGQFGNYILEEIEPSIIPKWKPAQNEGKFCNQRLRIRTHICLNYNLKHNRSNYFIKQ